jgi:hypothetical protein
MPPGKKMRPFIKSLLILALLGALFAPGPAAAQRLRIIPVPPDVVPQWTPVPDLPRVYYAPNIPTDVFRHRGRYYFLWAGGWYQSRNLQGPWMRVNRPPAILSRIQPAYFKTMPPTGGGAPGAPPGEGLLTPEGKPAVPPPTQPVAPTPPTPPTPPSEAQAPTPPTMPPPQEAQPPESQEPAPQAVPEGSMPKAM